MASGRLPITIKQAWEYAAVHRIEILRPGPQLSLGIRCYMG